MDNGKEFANRLFHDWAENASAEVRHSTPYYPQCNGKVERVNGLVKHVLRRLIDEHSTDWPNLVPMTQWLINVRPTTISPFSPYESFFLRHPPVAGDWRGTKPGETAGEWLEHVNQAKEIWDLISRADAENRIRNLPVAETLEPGQKVLVRRTIRQKLDAPLEGPFVIEGRHLNGTYSLRNMNRRFKRVHLVPVEEHHSLPVGEDVLRS